MKLAEFNALCDREWAKTARGGRGDVVSLCLSGPGAAELSTDIIVNPQQSGHILHIDAGEAAALRAGAGLRQVVNPVTRTVVKIRTKPGGKRETARVRVMGGTYRQTWWPAST